MEPVAVSRSVHNQDNSYTYTLTETHSGKLLSKYVFDRNGIYVPHKSKDFLFTANPSWDVPEVREAVDLLKEARLYVIPVYCRIISIEGMIQIGGPNLLRQDCYFINSLSTKNVLELLVDIKIGSAIPYRIFYA